MAIFMQEPLSGSILPWSWLSESFESWELGVGSWDEGGCAIFRTAAFISADV